MPSKASKKQTGQSNLYGRKMVQPYERSLGKKRRHRSIEEKLRKYETRAEGYEFVPALMHLLKRYVTRLPEKSRNEMDRRLAQALKSIPNARKTVEAAVKAHERIPMELKRRAFSPYYLTLDVARGIDVAEAAAITRRAQSFQNRPVSSLYHTIARAPSLVASLPPVVAQSPTAPDVPNARGCCCCCCCDDGGAHGEPLPPPPPPNQYELTFTKLYCVDESDPEWAGDDEPYVVFGAITEEMAEAGTAARVVATPVYEDVEDGSTRPSSGDENLRIFGFTGPRAINSSVLITGSCWEHDLGDVSDTTDAVRTALTAVATKAASAGGVAGWVIAGVAVVGIGVSYLVDLIGADDGIGGTLAMSLTEADADAQTAAVNPTILGPLHFDGGDDDGIYDVYLKLRRV
jgi:hypothetical protein